ncbi:MAG: IgGFc-binding protein, partial [Candidatus Kapabacteria bacterium]|nr:IgGFc-binding protein [Candidatus Kapabacteria bacterium]
MINYLIFIIFSACFCTVGLSSQTTKSMYGTKFFIAWPFNGGPDTTYCHFSINALNKTTSGFIKTSDTIIPFTLTNFENSFTYTSINNPNTSQNFYSKYEVKESEVIENKGVYIETKDSVLIILYTQNYDSSFYQNLTFTDEQFLSENTLVYPINTLSKTYRVLTKSEDSASSQFLIVATEDSTEIEILPSQNTEKGKPKGVPFYITLQKGQTYLVRSLFDDLTGSKIISKGPECKPFAVFVGSPSTTIAKTDNPFFQNKNTLLEQLPPTEIAGKRYIIERNNDGPNNFYSTIRILAINDSTQIIYDGQYLGGVLSAGQFVDLPTNENVYFYSEKPLLVAQFMRSLPGSNPLMVFRNSIDNRINTILFPSNLGRPPNISSIGIHSLTKILMRCNDTSSLFLNGLPQQNNGLRGPWEIIGRNPIYCFCNYYNIFDTNALKIESIYGEGIIAINFLTSMISSHAMSGVSSFDKFVFGGIDTSGIFTNYSYCQNVESIFEARVDSTASEIYWEFGDGNKANGKTVFNKYKNAGFYTVKLIIYRKAFCTYDTIRKIIDVKTSPIVKTGSRPIIRLCKGETVQIGRILDPNLTYRWSPSVGLSDSTVAVTTATVFQETMKYYLRGYDKYGCVGIDSITIVMYDQPIANAGPDTVSCGGNGVQIGRQTTGGTPNYSFLWTPSTGLSNDKIERPIAAPSTNTTYILRVTDANGCITYDTVNIQALPSPTINIATAPTICEGDSVQLVASGAPTYRWVNARNINDTTIGNPTVYPSVTTTYYVAGLFPTGCVAFDSVLVTVTPKPRLQIAFQTTACPNATKTYTVENRSDFAYNWEITGGNLTTGQGTNEATVVWGAGPTGSVKLTTTTAGSCSFDTTVNITISSDIKPTITESKKNTVVPSLGTVRICPNESVTLDVGVGYTEITWTNGSTSRQTTVSTEGWYGVSVKDATGCSGGDSVFVQIVPPPTVFAGNDRVLCGADTAVMRPTVTGTGTYTYQWIPPTAVSDPTSLVTNFIAPTTTNLIFQAIDTANGCVTADTVLMTILTLAGDFISTSKGNNVLCFGEQMTLDAGAFDSYTWST